MSFLEVTGYEFSEFRRTIMHKKDEVKIEQAIKLVETAMQVLEMVDDEYAFPVHEYETLADIRTDLTNHLNAKEWMYDS